MRTQATATTTSRETAAEIFVVTRRGIFAGRTSGRMDIWYAPSGTNYEPSLRVSQGELDALGQRLKLASRHLWFASFCWTPFGEAPFQRCNLFRRAAISLNVANEAGHYERAVLLILANGQRHSLARW